MIKIRLSDEKKEKIERIFIADAFNRLISNSLISILERKDTRLLLYDEFKILYNYLYDSSGELKVEELKKLLLADREGMEAYIRQFESCEHGNPKLLNNVFMYEKFARRKAAYNILREIDIEVCPYCNRLYITTLESRRLKAAFDHYFPQAKYPYLALSLYNLIPSCSICNGAKHKLDTRETPILYPYEEEFGEDIVFTTCMGDKDNFVKYMTGNSNDFNVVIDNSKNILKQQVDNQDKRLHITELYNTHKAYIQKIFKLYYLYTEKKREELLSIFPDIIESDDVINTIFSNAFQKEDWGNERFSKLTYDIYNELNKLSEE